MFSPLTRCLCGLLALLALVAPARALDPKERSISVSRQFIVYSPEVALRSRVSSFADELKGQWLELLGETDRWQSPIVITLERAAAGEPKGAPVVVRLIQHETGYKVQIDVRIGDDPAEVNLQKHLVRALFLEFAYRNRAHLVGEGMRYQEPPWWLVEGALGYLRARQEGIQADLFRRLVEGNRVPPLAAFLQQPDAEVESSTLQAVDQACAFSLVKLLVEQPSGRAGLAAYVRHLPEGVRDPVVSLQRDFPALSAAGGAQKWWTLNLARLSAANRFKGLSPEETDAELAALLQFDVPGARAGEFRTFGVGDFEQYLKLPSSRSVLLEKQGAVLALASRANALYRGIVGDYEGIFGLLVRGKTHRVKERLERLAQYRETLLRRKEDIADYMNWFEATRMRPARETTDGYIRAANQLSAPVVRQDPISRYLDEVAQEY